jgi:type I site-specific restriction-modification system R (restriction) subunit
MAWLGMAGRGVARHGRARHGKVRHGVFSRFLDKNRQHLKPKVVINTDNILPLSQQMADKIKQLRAVRDALKAECKSRQDSDLQHKYRQAAAEVTQAEHDMRSLRRTSCQSSKTALASKGGNK